MRNSFSFLLIVLAALLSLAAVVAVWANHQLLDQHTFVSTTSKALADPEVNQALASEATDQLYNNVDVNQLVGDALPANLEPLSGVAAASLRAPIEKAIDAVLASGPVRDLERAAIDQAYQETIGSLRGDPGLIVTEGNAFKIDLRYVLIEVANQIGLGSQLGQALPAGSAQVELVQSQYIGQARLLVKWLPILALWLPILVALLSIGAVALARQRFAAIIGLGGAFVVAGLALLLAGQQVPVEIANNLDGLAFKIVDQLWVYWSVDLLHLSVALAVIGALFVVAGLLASPWLASVRAQASLVVNRGSWPVYLASLLLLSVLAVLVGLPFYLSGLIFIGLVAWRYQMQLEGVPTDTSKFDNWIGLGVDSEVAVATPSQAGGQSEAVTETTAAAKRAPAKSTSSKSAPAKPSSASAKQAAAKKAPTKSASPKSAPAKKAPTKSASSKSAPARPSSAKQAKASDQSD